MKPVVIIPLLFGVFYGTALWTWLSDYSKVPERLEQNLINTAQTAQSLIPAEEYKTLLQTNPIPREKYKKLLEPLLQFHKSQPQIAHIYTINKIGEDYYSILDTSQEIASLNPNHKYKYEGKAISKIPAPDQGMEKALRGTENTENNSPNRSQTGADKAHYIPINTPDGVVGVLAATMSNQEIAAAREAITLQLAQTLAIYTTALTACGFIIVRTQSKSDKIQKAKTRIEEQFKTLTERMPGAVYIYSTKPKSEKGNLLFLSPGAKTLLKISPEEAEAAWREITDMLPEKHRTEEVQKIQDSRQKGTPWECEFESPTNKLWLQNKAVPKRDENGNTIWFGSLSDITLQKNESKRLGETNNLLRKISEAPNEEATLSTICDFTAQATGKSIIIYLCQNGVLQGAAGSGIPEGIVAELQTEREIGSSQGAPAVAAIQKSPLHVASIPDSSFYKHAEPLRKALLKNNYLSTTLHPLVTREGECLGVLEILHKDFEPEMKVSAQEEQGAHLALAAIEKHKGLKEIEENEKKYRKLFEDSPIAIIETDHIGQYVFSNKSFKNILQEKDTALFVGENAKEGKKEIKKEEKTFLAESIAFQKKKGEEHLITFLSNITEQKQREEKAITSMEVAEAANKAKSEFLAVMSHEIRTPLNGILGFSGILKTMSLEGKAKSYVDKIQQSGQTLLTTINDILDLSKIEAGRIDLEIRPYDLRKALEITKDILHPKIQEKGIRLEIVEENLPPGIIGDEVRMRQILINLSGNAVKFTDEGTVTIKASHQNDTLTIKIIDTGIGISPENQKKLFRPFSQADTSTTRKYGGTGLGLVICKKLANLMGGDILLESEVGKGTTFTVAIPAKAGNPSKEDEENPFAPQKEDLNISLQVLVAEDDEINTLLIQEILRGLGHQTKFAKNGREAVEMAQDLEDWADLILMDMRMPEMDGLEATQKIRELEKPNKTPRLIYALTANALDDTKDKCHQAGMNGHLSKPIEIKALKNILQIAQERKAGQIPPQQSPSKIPHSPTLSTPLHNPQTEDPTAEETFQNPPPSTENSNEAANDAANDATNETANEAANEENPTEDAQNPINTAPTPHWSEIPPESSDEASNTFQNNTTGSWDDADPHETTHRNPTPNFDDPFGMENPTSPPENAFAGFEDPTPDSSTQAQTPEEDWLTPLNSNTLWGPESPTKGPLPTPTENPMDMPSPPPETPAALTDWANEDPLSSFPVLDTDTLETYIESMGLELFSKTIGQAALESCRKGLHTLTDHNSPEKEKRFIAHKLRGSMGTLGFLRLMELGRRIEDNPQETYSNYTEIDEVLQLSIKEFENFLKTKEN